MKEPFLNRKSRGKGQLIGMTVPIGIYWNVEIPCFLQVEFERINGKVAVASKKLDTFDKVSAGKTRK